MYGDGGFEYHVTGQIIDARTGEPLAHRRVAVSGSPDLQPSAWSADTKRLGLTDRRGGFEDTFGTGIEWGRTHFLGIRVHGPKTPPIPPERSEVCLYVEETPGQWITQRVPVAPEQQRRTAPAERWLDLDTIAVHSSAFTLWQLPNQTHSQIMSYVIRTSGGKVIVIDGGTAGDAGYLKGFLAAMGNEVEAWFITHAHDDHFGAMVPILNQPDPPRIRTVYSSLPDLAWVRQHGYAAQDAGPYEQFLAALTKAGKAVTDLPLGADFRIDNVRVEVLGVRNPEIIRPNAINNSSLVLRMSDATKSVLFLADLGAEGGRKLLASPYAARLRADYCQMAHHGQDGVDEAFYRAVNPTYCLWPTPRWLWDNDNGGGKGSGPWKTLEVRAWMDKLSIKRHYVMTDGLCRIP